MEAPFEYVFPAIRGVQAHHEYFVTMCPMRLIPKIFLFDEEELVPELRAQRILNKARIPEISRYITDNRESYCFSAITASVDGRVRFASLGDSDDTKRIGLLHIPMDAKFIINDGQHRRAGIEMALKENPEIGDESIAVVMFVDQGLERCQQMFADLNRYAIRPARSLGVLYDQRDNGARLAKYIVLKSSFRNMVEMERSTLSARSRKLFTLSAIYTATNALLADQGDKPFEELTGLAISFWEETIKHFPEWMHVRDRKMTAADVRRDFIHSHGIVLQALGHMGHALIKNNPTAWQKQLAKLRQINWSRSNSRLWEGRAMVGGRVVKGNHNVTLTTVAIKQHMGLPLSPDEHRLEEAFR